MVRILLLWIISKLLSRKTAKKNPPKPEDIGGPDIR